jgi:hypothetical protein
MAKIYLYCIPYGRDVLGFALAEDGTGLASHLSSNDNFSKHDMGLTSSWNHEAYQAHYPLGFELEWVSNVESHEGLDKALELNKQIV